MTNVDTRRLASPGTTYGYERTTHPMHVLTPPTGLPLATDGVLADMPPRHQGSQAGAASHADFSASPVVTTLTPREVAQRLDRIGAHGTRPSEVIQFASELGLEKELQERMRTSHAPPLFWLDNFGRPDALAQLIRLGKPKSPDDFLLDFLDLLRMWHAHVDDTAGMAQHAGPLASATRSALALEAPHLQLQPPAGEATPPRQSAGATSAGAVAPAVDPHQEEIDEALRRVDAMLRSRDPEQGLYHLLCLGVGVTGVHDYQLQQKILCSKDGFLSILGRGSDWPEHRLAMLISRIHHALQTDPDIASQMPQPWAMQRFLDMRWDALWKGQEGPTYQSRPDADLGLRRLNRMLEDKREILRLCLSIVPSLPPETREQWDSHHSKMIDSWMRQKLDDWEQTAPLGWAAKLTPQHRQNLRGLWPCIEEMARQDERNVEASRSHLSKLGHRVMDFLTRKS